MTTDQSNSSFTYVCVGWGGGDGDKTIVHFVLLSIIKKKKKLHVCCAINITSSYCNQY